MIFRKKRGDVQVPGFSFQVNTLQRGEKRNLGLCHPNAPWDEHIYLHEWHKFMVNVGKYSSFDGASKG